LWRTDAGAYHGAAPGRDGPVSPGMHRAWAGDRGRHGWPADRDARASVWPDSGARWLGKVQFAIQTQHVLDVRRTWEVVVCAGAAGALSDGLAVGYVVVATEAVEHDIHNEDRGLLCGDALHG
jgi:Phosphorylase superfamily